MAKKKNRQHDEMAASVWRDVGANATLRESAATEAVRDGMDRFLDESGKNTPPAQLKGTLYERIEAERFNRQAALKGSRTTARLTAEDGRPHDPADIEIVEGDKVAKLVQSKVSDEPSRLSRAQANRKYRGMDRLVPRDKADATRLHSERRAAILRKEGDPQAKNYQDSSAHIEGELRHGEIHSGGTTTKELEFAAEHPQIFAFLEEGSAVTREAHNAGKYTADAAALIGGVSSTCKNLSAYFRGELDGQEAASNIALDVGKSAIRGYSTGAAGTFIRHGADKAGLTRPC